MASMDVPAGQPVPASRTAAKAALVKPTYITWLTLAFMTTSSVASLRSAPTMAVYGLACVFLYLVPAIVFLLPQALVAAELASGWSGGVFRWVSEGLSAKWGLLAVWCQFAMTIFYYPTLLAFVASTLAYVFNPSLADNGVYTGVVIVIVFWAGVFLSARGGTGGIAKLASSGLLIGTLIPGAILVVLGIIYLLQGNASAAPMTASHLLPEWTGIASLVLIVNNFLSYSGMEMNAVHVSSLREPSREFPKAMFMAVALVLLIFILPALAISWVLPANQTSLTAGVMQAFSAFFGHFGLTALVPIVAVALVCASAGGMLTWLAGPSKGLLLIARREGYLPPFFQNMNEHGIPVNILVVQGAVTTVIAILYALIPSVSSAYWILSVMTTQVYLIVYLLMFVAAVQLRRKRPEVKRGYTAPALTLLCVVGFLASAAAIIIGFVPPSQFENGSTGAYIALILGGTVLIGLLPPWLFLRLRKPGWKQPDVQAEVAS
jgi:glutamate:GABA antiporter